MEMAALVQVVLVVQRIEIEYLTYLKIDFLSTLEYDFLTSSVLLLFVINLITPITRGLMPNSH